MPLVEIHDEHDELGSEEEVPAFNYGDYKIAREDRGKALVLGRDQFEEMFNRGVPMELLVTFEEGQEIVIIENETLGTADYEIVNDGFAGVRKRAKELANQCPPEVLEKLKELHREPVTILPASRPPLDCHMYTLRI